MIIKVHTDGGSKGNPGPSSIGIVMHLDGKKIWAHHEEIGVATNNDAEYTALIRALEQLIIQIPTLKPSSPIVKVEFYSDSKLMVNQVNGLFKVKKGKLKEYVLQIRVLEQEINLPITYTYIPREQNSEADRLVNS